MILNTEGVEIPLPRIKDGKEIRAKHLQDYFRNIIKTNNISRTQGKLLTINDIFLDAAFQPEIDADFPTDGKNQSPYIPHIIHQIWLSSPEKTSVPVPFIDNVQTFLSNNPAWTYFLWTNETARKFLQDRYPHLLGLYDRLPRVVSKGDMLRYIVIYEYGGLYVDMDTVNFRPLDKITMKYPCILVPEPFEHAVLWYRQPYIVINAIMACRSQHPFFWQIVNHLLSRDFIDNEVQSLGPAFLTVQYRVYNNISDHSDLIDLSQPGTSPYFFKGNLSDTHKDSIYIPNTRFFMDSPSPALKQTVDETCGSRDMSNLERRMCVVVAKRGYFRSPGPYTFIDHQWTHTWSSEKRSKTYAFTSVKNITRNFRCYL